MSQESESTQPRFVSDDINDLVTEYERTCNPAPYTTERALYERLCHALDREPLDRPALHGPLRTPPGPAASS